MKRDISSPADIRLLVDHFYEQVKNDNLLGPVFEDVVNGNWTPHLEKMYGFWETICFDVHRYSGSPFQKHIPLPINATHFDRWLYLFHKTIDNYFSGDMAEEVKKRASQMGMMFQYKLKHLKGSKEN